MDVREARSVRSALVPPELRGPARFAVGTCALVVLALGVRYRAQHVPGQLDTDVEDWLRAHVAGHAPVLHAVATVGSLLPVLVAVTVVAAVGYAVGRWRMVLLAVLGPAAAIAVTESLKPLFGRTINDYWSFPSGHTTAVVSLLTVLALIWLRRPGRGVAVVVGSVFLVQAVLAAGMAIALIRLHLHYATDIAGGGCTGFAVVVVVAFVTERLGGRR